MTKDDIIRMAKEASASGNLAGLDAGTPLWLERFAKLVAAKEREDTAVWFQSLSNHPHMKQYATAIRARGQA